MIAHHNSIPPCQGTQLHNTLLIYTCLLLTVKMEYNAKPCWMSGVLPHLLDPLIWDDNAIALQRLLIDSEHILCESHDNDTAPLLGHILSKGVLTKFNKNKKRKVSHRDPVTDDWSDDDGKESDYHHSQDPALLGFAASIQSHVFQLRNALRSGQGQEDSLYELARRCKKANCVAKEEAFRSLGTTDSLSAAFTLVMVMVWMYESRNFEHIWSGAQHIVKTNGLQYPATQARAIETHLTVLSSVWMFGSDCKNYKLKLSKNYLLNALSILFRTKRGGASFKHGGDTSAAMKVVGSHLSILSQMEVKEVSERVRPVFCIEPLPPLPPLSVCEKVIVDDFDSLDFGIFDADIDDLMYLSALFTDGPELAFAGCSISEYINCWAELESWVNDPSLMLDESELFSCDLLQQEEVMECSMEVKCCKKRSKKRKCSDIVQV